VAQAATVDGRTTSRPPGRGATGGGPAPRLHLGRLAVLVLVLIGASFYVAPLRAFFTQQDRYQRETTALQAARADNAAYKVQVQLLSTKDYVAQRALLDSMLVPPDTQVFVVKGLPGHDTVAPVVQDAKASAGSISVLDRINDLWRTLLR
jgi:cell division protein FtsB